MSVGNVILTGFMGSGKSTIGRKLAKKLNTYFIDTDNLIENFENMSVSDIFEKYGENVFREKEKYCFDWIKRNVNNTIISVGGGFPVYIPQIREAGIVIYLRVPFEEILNRMSPEEIRKRPLFQDINVAKELYEIRDKTYSELADYIVDNLNIYETLSEIERIIHGSKQ